MSPIDWATRPLKKYADFSGRAPRAEFWWFYLLLLVAVIVASIIDSIIGFRVFASYGILACLVYLAFMLPYIAVGVRRLHDSDRTGWWMAGALVPMIGGLAMMGPMMADPAALEAGSGNPAALMGAGLLMLIGGIVSIVLLVFFVSRGTVGPNRYGEDPYAASVARAM